MYPWGASTGHQCNVNYCSPGHLDLGAAEHLDECSERIKLRTMVRAAAISALVFHCVQQRIWPTEYFIGAYSSCEELQVQCIKRKFPQGVGENWSVDSMEKQEISAAMSFGMSVRAINLSTLPICWLLDGLAIQLRGWNSVPVVARQTTLHLNGRQLPKPIPHVFFTMNSTKPVSELDDDSVVVDLSAPQYGYKATIERSHSYLQHRVHRAEDCNFDRYFQQHRHKLSDDGPTLLKKPHILLEIAIRIVCNVLYENIMNPYTGGINGLFTTSRDNFASRMNQLSVAIYAVFDAYKVRINSVIFNHKLQGCDELLNELAGQGFHEMTVTYNKRREAGYC